MGNKSTVCHYREMNSEVCDAWHNSNFTMDEIYEWYESFKQAHPTGAVTMEEFKSIYRDLCEEGNPDEFAERIFRLYDTDSNGTLNFREFISGVSPASSWNDPRTRIEWIFKLYDLDTDGHISISEMAAVLRSILKMSPNRTQTLQAKLQMDLQDISAEEIANRIFERFDTDQDGKLTKQELIDCTEEDPLLSHLLS